MPSKVISSNLDRQGSKAHEYWNEQSLKKFYKLLRPNPKTLPKGAVINSNSVFELSKTFHLRGVEFGNWLTNEDRYNYLATLFICLDDLNSVLKFKNKNVGLNKTLGISLGARGSGRAMAHYSPGQNIINITRYKRNDKLQPLIKKLAKTMGKQAKYVQIPKQDRFLQTGGVGSFAHEYGHFLDYVFGGQVEQDKFTRSLSGGSSLSRTKIKYPDTKPMRQTVEEILNLAFWKNYSPYNLDQAHRSENPNSTSKFDNVPSQFILRVEANAGDNSYWYERCEVFARLFEQYIKHKLKANKNSNWFLTSHAKYDEAMYMTPAELKKVIPLFDKLIILMRKKF